MCIFARLKESRLRCRFGCSFGSGFAAVSRVNLGFGVLVDMVDAMTGSFSMVGGWHPSGDGFDDLKGSDVLRSGGVMSALAAALPGENGSEICIIAMLLFLCVTASGAIEVLTRARSSLSCQCLVDMKGSLVEAQYVYSFKDKPRRILALLARMPPRGAAWRRFV